MSSDFASPVHFLLYKMGYKEISHTSTIVRDALRRAFARIGEGYVADLFFNHMADIYGLREDQYLVRFELVEKSLGSVFGDSVNMLFAILREELLKVSDIRSDDCSTGDITSELHRILYRIAESRALKFVGELPAHEHITLFYADESSKEKVVGAYLGPEAYRHVPKMIFCPNPAKFEKGGPEVRSIAYGEFEVAESGGGQKQGGFDLEKMAGAVDEVHGRNATRFPTRVVGEQDDWFIDNGYLNELLDMERALGRKVKGNLCYLCVYDSSRITEEQLGTLASCHDFIIADNPMVIYRSGS